MRRRILFVVFILLITALIIQSCRSSQQFRTTYSQVNAFIHQTGQLKTKPFLKAHLKNGDICILRNSWTVSDSTNRLNGIGEKYDFNRRIVFQGKISIPIDSVALFETNEKIKNPESGRIAALSVLTGIDLIFGIVCLTNPKACFGSCPTFYLNEKDNFHYADAEGFSNAILPSMEYGDIDALRDFPLSGRSLSLTMKNEALETHCVNDVKLYAFQKNENEQIFHTPANNFYLCGESHQPLRALAEEGDITGLLNNSDRKERFSLSDENNLCSKEEIILYFEEIKDGEPCGLILNFRQTLMTTYFIYSAMGYMGDEVGDVFANVENSAEKREVLENGLKKELGNIDVYVWDVVAARWVFQGGYNETGPIAINRQFMPFNKCGQDGRIKVKLVLNKGLWRIDYAALALVKEKVNPLVIEADSILNKGKIDPEALDAIRDPERHLISMPGSAYKFSFTLPLRHENYAFFLYSKGYYLEWMRSHWIKDKDLIKLHQMVYRPKQYLKAEAKNYKSYEGLMEEEFWNSKIDTKGFTYHDN